MSATSRLQLWALAAAFSALVATPALGQGSAPLLRDAFPIGDSGGSLCQVQANLRDPAVSGMFDRAWSIMCRDAAQPIGYVRALRGDAADIDRRLAGARPAGVACDSAGQCSVTGTGIGWVTRRERRGGTVFIAEGYAAYDDALRLALASIVDNQIAAGSIKVVQTSTGAGDGLARDQAATIDIDKALGEGYRRNHSGEYADAAEFFEALARRNAGDTAAAGLDPTEFTLNRALQKSNLGEFAEADRLFEAVDAAPTADMVQQRLRRNYHAIDALNRQDHEGAIAILSAPLPPIALGVQTASDGIRLNPVVAAGLNSGAGARALLQAGDDERLTPYERALIIDAQAVHLMGTAERLRGNPALARDAQMRGLGSALAVREGRVTSIIRLRSQMLGEIALSEEALGNGAVARQRFVESITLLGSEYPETTALASARARYAAYLARTGDNDGAVALYREVVGALAQQRRTITGLSNQMAPYFQLLADRSATDDRAVADLFLASQLLVRPGVADTQAVLARELSSGSGEGARLFRQATNLARDIERSRVDDARLAQLPATPDINQVRGELAVRLAGLGKQQAETLDALGAFPQYRAVEQGNMTLGDLQKLLGDGEAYAKLMVVGDAVYAMFVDATGAQAWRAGLDRDALDRNVDLVRASITVLENGRQVTYPYDVAVARTLYTQLFGPAADRMASVRHLIFEPDGAMLRLPANLLVTADTGVAAYQARLDDPETDAFDLREIAFLGRTTRVSTAVSPLAFRSARQIAPSRASRQYLGMGQNVPVTDQSGVTDESRAADLNRASGTRGASGLANGSDCFWPLSAWNRPISPLELQNAQSILGADRSALLTGAAFTDTAIVARADIADYRILHFATHGLVTAPRPQCPARPALLTSFGGGASDGLLTFNEIFDMKIDADLVILSACDTAGTASVSATREAGVSTGGGSALDGLVRAFIGAGGRAVIASHWPVPDDYDATKRLIGGLFSAPAGTGIADALWTTQTELMGQAPTSHPYYWAGFAIVGDGRQALMRDSVVAATEPSDSSQRRAAR